MIWVLWVYAGSITLRDGFVHNAVDIRGRIKIDKKASSHPFVTLNDDVHVANITVHDIPVTQYLNSCVKEDE